MAIYDVLQNPNSVAVSTTVQVIINNVFVGVVQSLEPSQTRSTTAVRGIGIGDRQIQRVWGLSEYTINFQKMALFDQLLFEALGYSATFRMIAELRAPITIFEQILFPDGSNTRNTFYRGCYLNNYTAPRSITGDIIILENGTFDCTSIDDGNGQDNPFNYPVGVS